MWNTILSKVFFIATSNVLHTIPPALQDRLEILRLSGYTEREKLEIAKRHLVPKQAEGNGLKPEQLDFTDEGIARNYSPLHARGGRSQSRTRDRIVLPQAGAQVRFGTTSLKISRTLSMPSVCAKCLGPIKFRQQGMAAESEIGLATGLGLD